MKKLLSAFRTPAILLSSVILLPAFITTSLVQFGALISRLPEFGFLIGEPLWPHIVGLIFIVIFVGLAGWLTNKIIWRKACWWRASLISFGIALADLGAGFVLPWENSVLFIYAILGGTIFFTLIRYFESDEKQPKPLSTVEIVAAVLGIASITFFLIAIFSTANPKDGYAICVKHQQNVSAQIYNLLKEPSVCSVDNDCVETVRFGSVPCNFVISAKNNQKLKALERELISENPEQFCRKNANEEIRMKLPLFDAPLASQARIAFRNGNCPIVNLMPKCMSGRCIGTSGTNIGSPVAYPTMPPEIKAN